MFKIQRFSDCGGIRKQWLKVFTSGTIAIMCPNCYNLVFINGRYNYNISVPFADNFYFDTVFGFRCACCEHTVEGIELDPNIACDISRLNRKGYKTKYCCEGHFSNKKVTSLPYILFDDNIYISEDLLPKSWYIEDGYDNFIIRGDIFHYSKKQILRDLTAMVDKLPNKNIYFDETTFM